MPDFRLAAQSLHTLRRRLEAEGVDAAAVLTEAGVATGHALAEQWVTQVESNTGLERADQLDQRWFEPMLTDLLAASGWGHVSIDTLQDAALLIENPACPEADPDSGTGVTCHFTAGALATFLSDLAGAPFAVIEVGCLAAGDASCQFLAGSPELIAAASDLIAAGGAWREVVADC